MVDVIKKYGWDGEWFIRAYDYYGIKLEAMITKKQKIFIESQGWCTMAGIGKEEGLCTKALNAVKERLDSKYGIVLNNPAFTRYYVEYGEISSYPAGYKENAGVFCHNNPWIMIGETVVGNGTGPGIITKRYVRRTSRKSAICIRQNHMFMHKWLRAKMLLNRVKPKNSWLTGLLRGISMLSHNNMLGIRPEYDGLLIDPCIPTDWKGLKQPVNSGVPLYQIEVVNPDRNRKE